MATTSKIEWTEQTWNPIVGCTKISAGCKHCYAETLARRLRAMGTPGYENGFALALLPHRLEEPLRRKKPTIYFVNSMSDLFHEKVPDAYIEQIVDVMARTPQHSYQVLTKRAARTSIQPAERAATCRGPSLRRRSVSLSDSGGRCTGRSLAHRGRLPRAPRCPFGWASEGGRPRRPN